MCAVDVTFAGEAETQSWPDTYVLILRGGGVRGIALVGALIELERYYAFDTFVGTSGGAITATLMAAGYTAAELKRELLQHDFKTFLDASIPRAVGNLIRYKGLYRGDTLRAWVRDLVGRKVARRPVRVRDLPKHAVLYAAMAGRGVCRFDSKGERDDYDIDVAARASMSIPYLFTPVRLADDFIVDGGLLNNFPAKDFLGRHPGCKFIGVYLGSRSNPPAQAPFLWIDLLRMWLTQDEQEFINEHEREVVVIDTEPVRTTDFNLTDDEKRFLLVQGQRAALTFVRDRGMLRPDDIQRLAELEPTSVALHELAQAAATRRRRSMRRTMFSILATVLVLITLVATIWVVRTPDTDRANVDEIKWVFSDSRVVDAVRAEIRGGGHRSLVPGYVLQSVHPLRLDEVNIYYDTGRFAFYHDDVNLILKTFAAPDGMIRRAQWFYATKRSSPAPLQHGWYRDEQTVEVTLQGIRTDDLLMRLSSMESQVSFPPEFRRLFAATLVDITDLRPVIVVGVQRDRFVYHAPMDGLRRRRVALELTSVGAAAYPVVGDSLLQLRLHDLRANAPVRWWEIEIEERVPLDAVPDEALWKRAGGFRRVYDLREVTDDMVHMSKYQVAIDRLGLLKRPDKR